MSKAIAIDLAQLLGSKAEREEPAMPLPEAQVMGLREFCNGYMKNPFKVGDLVQPRKSAGIKDNMRQQPWIVVESLSYDLVTGTTETHVRASCLHKVNIRTAVMTSDGSIICFWHAAHDFEPYVEVTE